MIPPHPTPTARFATAPVATSTIVAANHPIDFVDWAEHYFTTVLTDPSPRQLIRARGAILSAYTAHRASIERTTPSALRDLRSLDAQCAAALAALRCLELRSAPTTSPHQIGLRRLA